MRRLICLFLLMVFPLQAFALQGGLTSKENVCGLAHEIEHQHAIGHHHEDDGSIHDDDSMESSRHLVDHECCQLTATLPSAVLSLTTFPPDSIVIFYLGIAIPDGFLERPQKPPSALG